MKHPVTVDGIAKMNQAAELWLQTPPRADPGALMEFNALTSFSKHQMIRTLLTEIEERTQQHSDLIESVQELCDKAAGPWGELVTTTELIEQIETVLADANT